VARFFRHMISENVQVFWSAVQRGEFITDAAEAVGTYRKQGAWWVVASGGVRPRRGRNLQGRALPLGAQAANTVLSRIAGRHRARLASTLASADQCVSLGRIRGTIQVTHRDEHPAPGISRLPGWGGD
jgi:hypothetical protein